MNVKLELGGGRLPVVGGEDHTPAVGDHTQCCTRAIFVIFTMCMLKVLVQGVHGIRDVLYVCII